MPQTSQNGSNTGWNIPDIITHLEQRWASAAKENNATEVAQLLADAFVEMDADGTIYNRPQVLDRIKAAKWQVNEVSDIKVVVNGNMAVATGVWHGKGTRANGKPIDAREQWLDTWHKNGKWQCIASASAPITH
jgi:ketosteroid isomerase-like protein